MGKDPFKLLGLVSIFFQVCDLLQIELQKTRQRALRWKLLMLSCFREGSAKKRSFRKVQDSFPTGPGRPDLFRWPLGTYTLQARMLGRLCLAKKVLRLTTSARPAPEEATC